MEMYSQQPKPLRIEFKSLTKDFLVDKLGSEERFKEQCILSYTHENQQRTTYGIPMKFMVDYKKWALKELRARFGEAAVPHQPFEDEDS
jgi:hypothetical protein